MSQANIPAPTHVVTSFLLRRDQGEEAGVDERSATLLRSGEPLAVVDDAQGLHWVVHPFLFLLMTPDAVRTDWEATDHRWVRPDEVASYPTVPKLAEALAAVYPPEAQIGRASCRERV